MKKLLLAASLLAGLASPAFAVSTADRIVAVVNNSVITLSELNLREQEVSTSLKSQKIDLPAADLLARQVLDQMINEQLQLQFASNNGIRVSELDLDSAMLNVAKQNKTDLPGLRKLVEKDGLTLEQLREQLRKDLLLQRIREREIASRVTVSDQEVDQILKSASNLKSTEYHLAVIQVNVPERADAAIFEQRRQKLLKAQSELQAGKPFAQVAASYSEAQNALQGGDLGWRSANALPADFAQMLEKLQPGATTDIVRSSGSLYLFKLVEKRNDNAPQFVQQYKVRHILVKTNEATSETDAYNRILQVQDRLKRGAKFEDLAKQFSEDGTAALGGDLGWVSDGDTVPDFERAVHALHPGQISEPIKSPFGWHLIRLDEVRSQNVSDDRERLTLKQQLRQRKMEQSYTDWLEQLRASAFIDDRLIEK
ncbi:peptidylprolyl isomerase [Vogesella sp. LIG4]|uniref:peptidylprolyl isomerase n=1 Tax=Vogesella sp. LIG4 TaxID=1192162 RepID=UPI00082009AE|nr:peptidylprolyl isomerase [Vogesella sp. LIG4]SCK14722.1 periplasmic chaperone for outer membrane proteins SurA [Vogesella sp. LIG4]